jgi:hypothetical protein
MRSEALKEALRPRDIHEVTLTLMGRHRHNRDLGNCTCYGVEYSEDGSFEMELVEHDAHQAGMISKELVRLLLIVPGVEVGEVLPVVRQALGSHRRWVDPARCTCGVRYDQTDLLEGGQAEHDRHAAAVAVGQLQIRGMAESAGGVPVTTEAVAAALKAMEGVTPPPGIDKSAWLQQWGRSALVAGGVAAALRATELGFAASEPQAEAAARTLLKPHTLVYPYAPTGLRMSCTCGALLDDFDPMTMTPLERHGNHLAAVIAAAGWQPTALGDTENILSDRSHLEAR